MGNYLFFHVESKEIPPGLCVIYRPNLVMRNAVHFSNLFVSCLPSFPLCTVPSFRSWPSIFFSFCLTYLILARLTAFSPISECKNESERANGYFFFTLQLFWVMHRQPSRPLCSSHSLLFLMLLMLQRPPNQTPVGLPSPKPARHMVQSC